MTTITIIPNENNTPPGKLADAELHFSAADEARTADSGAPTAASVLDGLKLVGFSIWERRAGGRNVTFPARSSLIYGDRRSFALLRPIQPNNDNRALTDAILAAYAEYEKKAAGGV